MEIAQKIQVKLERLLNKLKVLNIIQTFNLEIRFCEIEDGLKANLIEIDSILKKCLRKIISKPRKAEIRNIITELIRKKNCSSNRLQDKDEKEIENNIQERDKFLNHSLQQIRTNYNGGDILMLTTNCDSSQYNYDSEQYLMNSSHSPRNLQPYLCEMCGELFNDVFEGKLHNQMHLTDSKFECEECLMSFPTHKKLRIHVRMHKNKYDSSENENEVENENMNQYYTQRLVLPKKKLTKGSCVTCFVCNVSFPSKKLLNHHLVEEHKKTSLEKIENVKFASNENKFVCDCGREFRLLKTLKKHKTVKHSSKNIAYTCTICKRSYAEKGKLNRHMLSHKCGQYQCSFCFKQFARSDVLKRHLSIAHYQQKSFYCSFCNKKFNLKYNKDVHEENIHRNVNNWIQCEHCGQKFRNKITFKSHLKIHLGKQVTCSICSRSFNRKINYKNHMKNKHFGISPFQTLLDSVTADFGD